MSTALRSAACPRCGSAARLDGQNPWRPFCSERCKLIDLGDWFAERRGIAAEPTAADGEIDDTEH